MKVQAATLTCKNQAISLPTPAASTVPMGASEMQTHQYLSEKDGVPAGALPSRC